MIVPSLTVPLLQSGVDTAGPCKRTYFPSPEIDPEFNKSPLQKTCDAWPGVSMALLYGPKYLTL